MKSFARLWLLPLAVALICAIAVWMFIRSHFFVVSGNAMFPYAVDGDVVRTESPKNINSGDILLINNPLYTDNKEHLSLQRCVAMPGDKVQIFHKRLYVNDILQNSDYCSFDIKMLFLSATEKKSAVKIYNLIPDNEPLANTVYVLPETKYQKIVSDSILKHVEKCVLAPYLYDSRLFPFSHLFTWNKDYYGPIVVPFKGMKIKLNTMNYVFYKFLFDQGDEAKVECIDNKFYVDGKVLDTYTFCHDYYYLLNDYRDDTSDSRSYGPISNECIKARVTQVFLHL